MISGHTGRDIIKSPGSLRKVASAVCACSNGFDRFGVSGGVCKVLKAGVVGVPPVAG